jgi:hypothetical protein
MSLITTYQSFFTVVFGTKAMSQMTRRFRWQYVFVSCLYWGLGIAVTSYLVLNYGKYALMFRPGLDVLTGVLMLLFLDHGFSLYDKAIRINGGISYAHKQRMCKALDLITLREVLFTCMITGCMMSYSLVGCLSGISTGLIGFTCLAILASVMGDFVADTAIKWWVSFSLLFLGIFLIINGMSDIVKGIQ